MAELFHGPVQQWQPTPEDAVTIERLLASDDPLDRAYGEAYQNGCYIREFGGADETNPESGLAAVGDLSKLIELEFRHNTELNQTEFSLGDCINLGAYPGRGETRATRVLDGVRQVIEDRKKIYDPEALMLFGSFTEQGYKVDAFMPQDGHQKQQWTIRVYKEGEEELFREETLEMTHAPIFGVDVEDKSMLEARIDDLMRELTNEP